ncbi:hypothetical protein F4809DRAFT_641887 [Biscogniauxia mediterranea]|nr:hypothetical protein F4809DRAFT_641887 [Biscogniauxia mediterranea]
MANDKEREKQQQQQQQRETSPSISELARLAARSSSPEAFRLRASAIEHLAFYADDASDAAVAALEPYLRPSLRRFCLYGGPVSVSDAFLDKLQKSCPNLEHFLLDNPRDLVSPAGLLRFVNSPLAAEAHRAHSSFLTELSPARRVDRALSPAVLRALAARPGLEILRVGGRPTSDGGDDDDDDGLSAPESAS